MLEDLYRDPTTAQRLRRGPLGPYLESFSASLLGAGYTPSTVRLQLSDVAAFGRWLADNELATAQLDEGIVDAFLVERQRRGRPHERHRAAIRRLVEHLWERGIVAPPEQACKRSPIDDVLGQYDAYLRRERGLAPSTVANYQALVRRFLAARFADRALSLRELGPSDASSFLLAHARSMGPGQAKLMVTALRSFFRFLFQRDETEANLAEAVPPVADWRQSTVPKFLTPQQVDRLLDACDRTTTIGRRNYAILLLLARLGLRAGEVVALELDDIDWRAGELLVRGKGSRQDRLPLVPDVGEALAEYLRRDRPASPTRRVFISMRAPLRAFAGPSTVTTIVRRALERAGLHPPVKGAHLLRHSLATKLLRQGASLTEIGELLRHRTPATTEIYAKVDFRSLRSLAQPWPVTGGRR